MNQLSPTDLSNAVTAAVIILLFALTALVALWPKKAKAMPRFSKPIITPNDATIQMREIIANAETIGQMKCIEALKESYKMDYANVFTEDEIRKSCLAITAAKFNKCMEIWKKDSVVFDMATS